MWSFGPPISQTFVEFPRMHLQDLMQVRITKAEPSITEMEQNVFGDLDSVYTKTLASARAERDDGSAWYVPPASHADYRTTKQVPTAALSSNPLFRPDCAPCSAPPGRPPAPCRLAGSCPPTPPAPCIPAPRRGPAACVRRAAVKCRHVSSTGGRGEAGGFMGHRSSCHAALDPSLRTRSA